MHDVPSKRAILGLDVLIDDPEILNPEPDTPKLADEFYIPLGYAKNVLKFTKENSNRGDACRDLAHYLPILLSESEKNGDFHDTKLDNDTIIHFAEIDGCPNPVSSHDQSIALAKKLLSVGSQGIKIFASHDTLTLLAASNFIPYEVISPRVYTGRRKVFLPSDNALLWFEGKAISDRDWLYYFDSTPLKPNEYVEFELGPNYYASKGNKLAVENIGRYTVDRETGQGKVVPLAFTHPEHKAYKDSIFPQTAAQAMMFDALLAPVSDIPLVIIPGPAGSGKTFCSVAAGLSKIEEKKYERFFVVGSESKLGEKQGFLPGNMINKILPFSASVIDALRAVIGLRDADKSKNKEKFADCNSVNDYTNNPLGITPHMQFFIDRYFQFMPLRFIKGMSVPGSVLYFDEAQDFTRSQVSELLTRCGENSKVILTGDPNQSDFADKKGDFSGLDFVTRRLVGTDYAAVIRPTRAESVRSYLTSRVLEDIDHF